jgi:hypothetical protein
MSKFKVGDKVAVKKKLTDEAGWAAFRDATVTATERTPAGLWPIAIKSNTTGNTSLVAEHEIRLLEQRDYVADHARRTIRKAGGSKEFAAAFVKVVQGEYEFYKTDKVRPLLTDGKFDLSKFSRSLRGVPVKQLAMAVKWNKLDMQTERVFIKQYDAA